MDIAFIYREDGIFWHLNPQNDTVTVVQTSAGFYQIYCYFFLMSDEELQGSFAAGFGTSKVIQKLVGP